MNQQTLFEFIAKGMRAQHEVDKLCKRLAKAPPKFNGRTFESKLDGPRLTKQLDRVREYVLAIFPAWKSVYEIALALTELYEENFPTQSISARLRDLRKRKFGSYTVEKKRRTNGTWEYLVFRS